MRYSLLVSACAVAIGTAALAPAAQISATFFEGTHGEVITNKFLATYGFNVSAVNVGGGPNKAMIFDSRKRGTLDPDLEGWNAQVNPPQGPEWPIGNLKGKNDFGKLLVIAENDIDANNNGLIDNPSDEGSRPAGRIIFDFRVPTLEFGLGVMDIEGPSEFGNNSGYIMTFEGIDTLGRGAAAQIGFGQFVTPGNPFYDPTIVFGDHSANRIKPILASQVGMASFSRVIVDLGGSGALDDIKVNYIPEPAGIFALAGAAALFARRQRRA
jgi:hypothetical protein